MLDYEGCSVCGFLRLRGEKCPVCGQPEGANDAQHAKNGCQLSTLGDLLPAQQTAANKYGAQPLTGGSVDYYKLRIDKPASGAEPYTAECNDIIEALQMTYAEGNAFKAVWRHALARRGVGKKGNTMLYEAEKVEFFAQRLVEQAKG